ncbi:PseG/SpsG family protein [Alkaliphilus oremlandii]|uniref:Glycosyltransferase n=1 Tax=Alkaliphilus oremlandii (strain OhILAs) TaxID=350688 RepID=A8MJQ8_ALKOO|nr:glycosyl transferase [Alkaliphilus oremlandii]ABW20040.1 glycosyltransferase [Alkaliphilus oremlandii OhILAs]
MKNIGIRVLGGKGIGYGHYYRCLSLAIALGQVEKDINITFIINQELEDLINNTEVEYIINNEFEQDYNIIDEREIDLFIVDSYLGSNEYLKMVKEKTKLMIIDDNNDIYDASIPDIIYNGNIHAERLGYLEIEGQLKLLGPKYLIMKEEYWKKQDENIDKNGILITTGGTDDHGITVKIMDAIKNLAIKTRIIIGPGYYCDYIKNIEAIKTENMELIYKPPNLKKYIASSKIVITAGGSTVYEVLSQNTIPIIFSIADNQDLICKELSNIGIDYLGKYPSISYDRLDELIGRYCYKNMILKDGTLDLIGGQSTLSTAEIILSRI